MNVDIAALRAIEREKEISLDTVVEAIETALLTAYKHTEGPQPDARVEVDRKTGASRMSRGASAASAWSSSPMHADDLRIAEGRVSDGR